ncbi:type II toxin-antitoxin system YhaV family toxin [Photorhabdus aegyptia]|uniref:type II toxin-antitoxin system YhaV family toxin n=1 Tax=Photorhabdus aegyptia TaxID=2805098 RepID=UPI003B8A7DBC
MIKLVTEIIPSDPTNITFRLSDTLGSKRRHWFRAKFFQQYCFFSVFTLKVKLLSLAG